MSVRYPLKAIHIIEGETDEAGQPKPGAVVELELTNGDYIRRVDPITRKARPERQRFVMQDGGGLTPKADA